MRYAQIDENNICFAESFLSGKVIADDMIFLTDDEPSPLGKKYVNGIWLEIEQQEPVSHSLSDTEMIMQSLTDMELNNIELQQNQQLLAQQMSDIELMLLEKGN